ncbi:MAG: ABC transporter permease [Betaproteobacteria bacterium]|nr:MAG: ABC transporter permease [Betaproteobacteria bacterium]TMH47001.1 MAG: ABC transporter permease [Betaproteobacteria bacterium]
MTAYILRRLWQMIPTLAGVILLIFFLFKFFGGDPAQILAGQVASQEQIDAIRQQLGLDRPWYVQLGIFVRDIFSFDFGKSWMTREQVSEIFVTRLPATLTITLPILILEVALAIPVAMLVAYHRGTLLDRLVIAICVAAMSISFLVYIIVGQYVFGFELGWFPVQGWSDSFWRNLVTYAPLPILLAALVGLAPQTRLYRSFFLDETKSDYVRTARAKGLSDAAILRRHVLPNAMVPVLTNVALLLPGVFVGSFLLEIFFSIPGLGREVYIAVNRSDYPVIQAFTVYLAVLTMLINLGADVLYRLVDPRIQLT